MSKPEGKAKAASKPAAAKPEKVVKEKVVKEKVVKPPQDVKNGVVRPAIGTVTGNIWGIADSISAKLKEPAPRKDVLEQTRAENINDATAATQYGKWRKYNGLKSMPKPKAEPKAEVEKPAKAAKAAAE